MLRNPAYAGSMPTAAAAAIRPRRLPGREHSGRLRGLDCGAVAVRIEGALPAYISVEQYERNLARMAANRARAESLGAPREVLHCWRSGLLRGLRPADAGRLRVRWRDPPVLLPASASHLR